MLSPMDIDTTVNLVLRTDNEKNCNNEQLRSPLFASPCFLTSESNETPVIRNSRPEVLDSISELDRRQRERRESSEYQEAKLQDNLRKASPQNWHSSCYLFWHPYIDLQCYSSLCLDSQVYTIDLQ